MRNVAFFIAFSFVALLSGCSTATVNSFSTTEASSTINRIEDIRVNVDDKLHKQLTLQEIRSSKTNDGFMRVQVFLNNTSSSVIKIRYRFSWLDSNGVEVSQPDLDFWENKLVLKNDSVTLTSIAPKKDCKDFKLRVICVD